MVSITIALTSLPHPDHDLFHSFSEKLPQGDGISLLAGCAELGEQLDRAIDLLVLFCQPALQRHCGSLEFSLQMSLLQLQLAEDLLIFWSEVTRASLERIESLQPMLNCFLEVEAEEALATAAKADALLAKGEAMGPLHGVPLAHKDIFFRAGKICSGGTRLRQSHVMEHTATVLQRLAGAGALSLGRLNLSEFSIGPTGHNDHFGTCHNPWNLKCITGGSSSGPAAAVSARLIFGSLGSDTGGSVRIPAALCGLVGMKPTHGRVSRSGVLPISFSTDTPGPLTRTVRDCARLCRVIAGRDDDDAVTSTEPVEDYEASCGRNIRGIP